MFENKENIIVQIVRFPSKNYYVGHIIACAINAILTIVTIFLNLITLIVYWKSSQLQKKVSYFLIMVLSLNDLMVGMICSFSHTLSLTTEITGTANCVLAQTFRGAIIFLAGLSLLTLSMINMERYLGVLHPILHRTIVTRKKLLMCVVFIWFSWVLMLCAFAVVRGRLIFQASSTMNAFLLLITVYIYARIYLASRSSNRMVCSENGLTRHHNAQSRNTSELHGKTQFLQELKLAKSCFLVVICFFVCIAPVPVVIALKVPGFSGMLLQTWSVTLVLMNSSINSVVFFWRNQKLRNEAKKILKQACFC